MKHDGYGKAFPDPKDTDHSNAKLKVNMPPFPGNGDYWIVRLDESYSYAVVSSPDYHHLWVFYRAPIMTEQLYQSIYEDLKQDGFHVEKLRKTIQWYLLKWKILILLLMRMNESRFFWSRIFSVGSPCYWEIRNYSASWTGWFCGWTPPVVEKFEVICFFNDRYYVCWLLLPFFGR